MKNKYKYYIVLIIVIIGIFYFYKMSIKEMKADYKIDKYNIKEHFYLKDSHYYDFIITNKKNNYVYTINNNINKKKKIIKSIKTYKSNNLVCILPIYKKDISRELYCNIDNKQVSNYILLENKDYKQILKKSKKYHVKTLNIKDTKTKYKNLIIYKKNIESNKKYIIWDYKGIYIIDYKSTSYVKILNYDLYDNIISTVAGNYYVLFENSSVSGIENIYYYNLKKDKLKKFKLKEKLSKDSYINGVVDKNIYVTDKRNKKEYKIDIKKEKIEEIDNNQTKYIVYRNDKSIDMSKSDFFMKNHYFSNSIIKNKKVTVDGELRLESNYYYFLEKNKMYKQLKNNKNPILLFELDSIDDWYINSGELLIISNGILYSYTDSNGLRKIVESNELKYNYKNIYQKWEK